MNEEQKLAIIESGPVYLVDGLRATLGGWKNTYCGIGSAKPGFWACSWETAAEVIARPDRRFVHSDHIWLSSNVWLGYTPSEPDYQTQEDYLCAKKRGEAV